MPYTCEAIIKVIIIVSNHLNFNLSKCSIYCHILYRKTKYHNQSSKLKTQWLLNEGTGSANVPTVSGLQRSIWGQHISTQISYDRRSLEKWSIHPINFRLICLWFFFKEKKKSLLLPKQDQLETLTLCTNMPKLRRPSTFLSSILPGGWPSISVWFNLQPETPTASRPTHLQLSLCLSVGKLWSLNLFELTFILKLFNASYWRKAPDWMCVFDSRVCGWAHVCVFDAVTINELIIAIPTVALM